MTTLSTETTTFIFKGEGDVRIMTATAEVIIPFADILHFVAEHIRSKRIQKLEAMSSDELIQSLI